MKMEKLNGWQQKYYEDMLEIAKKQIYEEAKKKRKLYKEDDYILFCMFRKMTAGQCSSIIDELIEEGIYPKGRSERLFNAKEDFAKFLIYRKIPGYKEINDYWMYRPIEYDE